MRQYALLELRRLTLTAAGNSCVTLVACEEDQQQQRCVATLDVRWPAFTANHWPACLPLPITDQPALLSNVVVAPSHRRRGLARHLVAAAKQAAAERFPAQQLYAWAEADSAAALALYAASGFAEVGRDVGLDRGLALGEQVLLCCRLGSGGSSAHVGRCESLSDL